MKTEKTPTILEEVYKTFLDLMFYPTNPIDLVDQYVSEDVMGYGTTLDEKIFGLKDLKDLAILQRSQAIVLKFKFDQSPIYRKMMEGDSIAVLVDEIKISMLIDGEEVILNLRMSTIWNLIEDQWKLVHWHGSKPEYDSEGTDTWHAEEWQQKNEELQKQVEEKAAEIIQKNRELEIESALERVRATAMSMRKPDDILEVCRVISDQLEFLKVSDIRNTQVAIVNESKKTYLNYQYFTAYSKQVFEETEYENHPTSAALIAEMQKFVNNYFTGNMQGDHLRTFIDWRKKYAQFPDPLLEKTGAVYYYFYSIGIGGLGLTTYKAISEAELNIFKRFHKVFKLSYQRYRDIEQAEAQARETQIELALERVRARTMAMQHSDELAEASFLLDSQVRSLGIKTRGCAFNIYGEHESTEWFSSEAGTMPVYKTPREDLFLRLYDKGQSGETFYIEEINDEACEAHYEYLCTLPVMGEALKNMIAKGGSFPTRQIDHAVFFKYGYLLFITLEPVPEAHEIFKRFAKVFEQTYTRFLDLQKAETQTREAEIQLALEKVRMEALGLNKSMEMLKVAKSLYEQLLKLGFSNIRNAIIDINNGDDDTFTDYDYSHTMSGTITQMSYHDDPTLEGQFKKMSATTNDLFELVLEGKELEDLIAMRIKNGEDEDPRLHNTDTVTYNLYSFGNGAIGISNFGLLNEDEKAIINRFSNVFTFAYKRYSDLASAEALARETQIELSLERIRAQVTSMSESTDLFDIVVNMRSEFLSLGHEADYFWHMRWLADSYEMSMTSEDGNRLGMVISIPSYVHQEIPELAKWENGEDPVFVLALDPDGAWDYIENMNTHGHYKKADPNAPSQDDIRQIGGLTFIIARTTHGEIGFSLAGCIAEPPQEYLDTLMRFATVFDLAYRRFEDLKSTEKQYRETQIELSLERIRAQVTSMSESSNLLDIVVSMRTEFVSLGHEAGYFWYMRYLQDTYEKAMTSGDGTRIGMVMTLPRHIHGDIKLIADWEKSDEPAVVFAMDVETAVDYVHKMITLGDFEQVDPSAPTLDDIRHLGGLTFIMARTKHGEIGFSLSGAVHNPPEESIDTLVRFAAVFDLAYRRFEDLKDAERRNKETQIELALERSRNQSMLMKHSDELNKTSQVFHEQLELLGIESEFSYLWLPNESKKEHLFWATWHENSKGDKVFKNKEVNYPLDKTDPSIAACYLAWESRERVHINPVAPEEVEDYFASWAELLQGVEKFKPELFPDGIYYVDAFMKYGCFGIMINRLITDDEKMILSRFTIEFERAYTRFLDLKKSEMQTREARVETALERVRARALAMQQPEELKEVAQVMRQEMGLLGVEELETSSIYINDEMAHNAECWYAIKDVRDEGKTLVNDHFKLDLNDTWVGREMLKFYHSENEKVSILMTGKPRAEWIRYCEKKSVPLRAYYGDVIPDRTYHLYKFSHGAIGAATPGDFTTENWGLLKRAASVFSLAYSRFKDLSQARNDLQHLKEEKKRAEIALAELKSTQSQLIHAEKMASLGELTAGIAHEIQNPLNFVNNFSEVSTDLIEELNEELQNNNLEEVKEIALDLLQNLEKISTHGIRASSIVKGMLEHSRTGSGEKAPTDLKTLADEYLRLAYHGLRAKNKSFNADFKLNADDSLPPIKIIPQDIGRVLLNLINNSFHAVSEKAQQQTEEYKPKVEVSIQQTDKTVEIRVKDNGKGIPEELKEKIFQPFFTTKPTGEGTGLGLSLSYDIITKGHGGFLKVESTAEIGTEFIIELPI